MATLPRWKSRRFEKLTAAVQAAERQGAVVKWNEFIDGRQFDVTIRASDPGENYLTVIECKDSDYHIPVKEVEAFITQSKDAGASRAVMVSASGFQKGARRVAEKHGIELLELTEVREIPERFLEGPVVTTLNISNIRVRRQPDRREMSLSDHPEALDLLLAYTRIETQGENLSLRQALDRVSRQLQECARRDEQTRNIRFPEDSRILFPGNPHWIAFNLITVNFKWIPVRRVKTSPGVDPIVFEQSYNIRDSLTGEIRTISGWDFDHGFATELTPGRFYRDPVLRVNYACIDVKADDVTLVHLETEQHFFQIMMSMVGDKGIGKKLIPIEDAGEIVRLKALLESYLSAPREEQGS